MRQSGPRQAGANRTWQDRPDDASTSSGRRAAGQLVRAIRARAALARPERHPVGRAGRARSCCSRRRSAGCCPPTRSGWRGGRRRRRWRPARPATPSAPGAGWDIRGAPFACMRPRSTLVAEHGGEVPADRAALRALPGRGRLHRRRRCGLRLRPAPRRARHQRAPGDRPRVVRRRRADAGGDRRRAPTGRNAVAGRRPAGVGDERCPHGTRRAGLPGSGAVVRQVSAGRPVCVATGRLPRLDRPGPPRADLRGHRPPGPRRRAQRAAIARRAGRAVSVGCGLGGRRPA